MEHPHPRPRASSCASPMSGIAHLVFLPPLCLLLPPLRYPPKYFLSVLVELQLCNDNFAGVDTDGHALSVRLLAYDAFDVYNVLQPIDGGDCAFAAFV